MSEVAISPNADQPEQGAATCRRGFLIDTLALGAAASLGTSPPVAGAAPARGGATAVNPRLFTFVGGKAGEWSVVSAKAIVGDRLPDVERVDIVHGAVDALPDGGKWKLRGVTSNVRYTTEAEREQLARKQSDLGRPEATHAALIPIRKNAKWWALSQDKRRAIFEETSRHVALGLKYLPAIARRLHHCRDLGESEPFDFLTLFDYTKADAEAFDKLVAELRATEEWKFVEREVDIRLVRVKA